MDQATEVLQALSILGVMFVSIVEFALTRESKKACSTHIFEQFFIVKVLEKKYPWLL